MTGDDWVHYYNITMKFWCKIPTLGKGTFNQNLFSPKTTPVYLLGGRGRKNENYVRGEIKYDMAHVNKTREIWMLV